MKLRIPSGCGCYDIAPVVAMSSPRTHTPHTSHGHLTLYPSRDERSLTEPRINFDQLSLSQNGVCGLDVPWEAS